MKSNSFSKKLLAMFLAILMAISCVTGVMSAYASELKSSDTETTLYDDNLAYNFLGWVETTDIQTLDALLDFADMMMGQALGNAKDTITIVGSVKLDYDLSSINGIFSTLNSARQLLKNIGVKLLLGGDAETINLGGELKGYASTGNDGDCMTRENSNSRELIRGIVNILYMNGTSYAKNGNNSSNLNAGGQVLQHFLAGTFGIGRLEGTIIGIVKGKAPNLKTTEDTLYGIIGGLLGLPKGYQKNLVNNIVVYLLKTLVADDLTRDGVNNNINTSGNTYYFVGPNNEQLSIEQWAFDAINKGVLDTLIGVDSEYIFKDRFSLDVNDNGYDDLYNAFVPVFEHTLLPLLGTLSINHGFVTEFTNLYYEYAKEQAGFTAPTTQAQVDALWSTNAINAWINNDYETIAWYIGSLEAPESTWDNKVFMYPDIAVRDADGKVTAVADGVTAATVKDAMNELFAKLDEGRAETEIDATNLFNKLLYSPVAIALGHDTGVLNVDLKDVYFGNLPAFFDMSVLPSDGNLKDNVYGFLVKLLSLLFPTFDNWAPQTGEQTVSNIIDEVVASACNLIKFVGDETSAAIFADFTGTLNQSNIEEAVLPLIKALVGQIDMCKPIHQDEWDKCGDVEAILYVCIKEYLSYVLPQYDYSCLVDVVDGKYQVSLSDDHGALLMMARDALAYIIQSVVPIKDAQGNRWDVRAKGGTANGQLVDGNTTAYDMLNYILCYYAADSGVAQLLNLTKYSVSGTTGSAGFESAISINNSIWKNLDLIINKAFPLFSDWFGVSSISSKELIMDTIVNGIVNIADVNTSRYGHGKQGVGAILYNIVYMFTDSTIMHRPLLNVAYEFLGDIFNVVFGARDAGDNFGSFIPANTGVQPFTDLIQSRILAGSGVAPSAACDTANYSTEGAIGILCGRVAENSLAGALYTERKVNPVRGMQDTLLPGLCFILKSVSDLTGLVPTLGEHTFAAPAAKFTTDAISSYNGDDLDGQYLQITNMASGLNRAIYNSATGTFDQQDRYFIRPTAITCTNDSGLTVSLSDRYSFANGTYSKVTGKTLISPYTSAYYKVNGAPDDDIGSKLFTITYDITNKSGNVISNYTGLTMSAQFYITTDTEWFTSVYRNDGGLWVINNAGTSVGTQSVGNQVVSQTTQFGSGSYLKGTIPTKIILEANNISSFDNITACIYNAKNKSWGFDQPVAYDGYFIKYTDSQVTNNNYYAIPVFDSEGNVYNLDHTEYYYPTLDQWVLDNDAYQGLEPTDMRSQIVYTADYVKANFAGHYTFENGVCTRLEIPFEDNRAVYNNGNLTKAAKVSWSTPIPGVNVNYEGYKKLSSNEWYNPKIFDVADGVTSTTPGTYQFDIVFFGGGVYGSVTTTATIIDTSERGSANSKYNELYSLQAKYMASDYEQLSHTVDNNEVALFNRYLGAGTLNNNSTYYDVVQNALSRANASIATPISLKVTTGEFKVATDKITKIAEGTAPSVIGDLAYQQLDTNPGSIGRAVFALNKDELGNATSQTYYYLDEDGNYPIYKHTALDATADMINSDYFVLVDDATGKIATTFDATKSYTVHYRNAVEYTYDWVTTNTNYTAPCWQEVLDENNHKIPTGSYVAKQFKYSDAAGNESSSKKQWVYKFPDVVETDKPNTATVDYRSEYKKVADLLGYVLSLFNDHIESGAAMDIVNQVINDRTNLNENNFDKVSYQSMVKIAKIAEGKVWSYFDDEFKEMTTEDDDYEFTDRYDFYINSTGTKNAEKDRFVANTTYLLFTADVISGRYADLGLDADSVAGQDFYFGKWVPTAECLEEDGETIKWLWDTNASGLEIAESIRLYNLYKNAVVHRGYVDNDLAIMQEVLCATGDAYAYNYNIANLRAHTIAAYDATLETKIVTPEKGDRYKEMVPGSGVVTFADTTATPKYGALDANGVLVNEGDTVYTDESWTNYVDALALAVNSIDNAASIDGYTQANYSKTAEYENQVTATFTKKQALKTAENELVPAEPVEADGYDVTGTVVIMLNPAAPNVTTDAPALAGVTVTVGEQVATTGADGSFTLTLANGTYDAVIHYVNGYDRHVAITVNGANVALGAITMVPCDYDNNGIINVADTTAYLAAFASKDAVNGDFDGNGVVNVADTTIYKAFFAQKTVVNIYD